MIALASAALLWPPPTPELRLTRWEDHRAEPTDSMRVLWVGHSLVNHRDPFTEGSEPLPDAVGQLTRAAGLRYEPLEHTLFGASLSLLWRGEPHSYGRQEAEVAREGQELLARAEVDALVLTEGLPVGRSLDSEHGAYYAQRFACSVLRRNPDARIYVYETWSHLHASDPDGDYPRPSAFDWQARITEDRAHWERLADLTATGAVPEPGIGARLRGLLGESHGCSPRQPVYLVPVGTVFAAIDELTRREELPFADRTLTTADLFANAYTRWPEGWPLEAPLDEEAERRALEDLARRHPDAELDDIHPSALGIYVAALTHFATLYRRTPEGLPSLLDDLPEETAARLQSLTWRVVRSEARAGVR
ncbi:MAG: hypothetical protein KC586_28450 [Myxococcales bacterium]|nr:hypothetical protein [Myxococcales bacterium]